MKEFWDYFIEHEKEYRGYIDMRMAGGMASITEAIIKSELISQMNKIDMGLWVNLGKYVQGDYVMMPCFDPWEGKPLDSTIAMVNALIVSAPEIENWEIRKILPTDMMLV